MPSSSELTHPAPPPEALALLEKIEELSALRSLCDGLALAADFTAACECLTNLVWREHAAECVAYVTVDGPDGIPHAEVTTPEDGTLAALADPAFLRALLGFALTRPALEVLRLGLASAWLRGTEGTLLWVPTVLRGKLTGGLVIHTCAADDQIANGVRLLSIVAAVAALGLDAARVQAREDFLATLRHDIKNPLGVALGYLSMVDDKFADADHIAAGLPASELEEMRAAIAAAGESLKAVDDLVANYLHLAVIDRGGPALGLGDVDLSVMTGKVVERFRPAGQRKNVALTATTAGRVLVPGDRHQLLRVITNLIDNAIKYTPGPGRVDVTIRADGPHGVIEVRDDGIGLSAQNMTALFRRHARFHDDPRIPGSGLGLYLSKAIVEAHGGTIQAVSAPGKGSTFTVRLPLEKGAATQVDTVAPALAS
jgi:signal transduction histidine kinase